MPRFVYSKKEIDEAIALYQNGYSAYEIQEKIGVKADTVYRQLRKYNIKIVPRRKSPKKSERSLETEQKVIQMYKNGMTAYEIVKEIYFKTSKSVYDILSKYGIERRKNEDYSNFNDEYFNTIDTREKAYLLGWLISDGWVYSNKNGIGIQLQESDIKIIKLFKKELQSTGKISNCYKKGYERPMKRIIFTSEKTKKHLAKYGVVPQKSKITFLPKLRNNLMRHLIRGILEGDGSVFYYDKTDSIHIIFNGSEIIINQLRDFLSSRLKISKPKIVSHSCHRVCWTKRKEVNKILCYLYFKCGNLFLERKYESAKKYRFEHYKSKVFKEFRNTENI